MEAFVEILLVLIITAVPCGLWAVWYLDRYSGEPMKQYEQITDKSQMNSLTYTVLPYRLWMIELIDMDTGKRLHKTFHNSLTFGRTMGQEEPSNMLYIGPDQAISRKQCILEETRDGMVIRNLSDKNTTIHNGRLLMNSTILQQGDQIGTGLRNFRVLSIYRTA